MNLTAAVECRGLVKDYPIGLRGVKLRAVGDLTFTVNRGEIFGLLGANGCGKSTTLKLLAGIALPSGGQCRVLGESPQNPEVRRKIGYAPEAPEFYRFLTARELMRFYAEVSGPESASSAQSVAQALERVDLIDAADRKVGTFSKGMLQRVSLAQALVHDPEVLILDEPVAGVDPLGIEKIGTLLRELRKAGKTILLTSHLLHQVAALCDRVAIMDRGRVLTEVSLAELSREECAQTFATGPLSAEELYALRSWLAARGHSLQEITSGS
ncbi:MAG TPA: ABC transporter ATP-binding protein, partial [Opitutus sp.]|nr:ABC transporter ATP-binding protein [Opitutus sp.]